METCSSLCLWEAEGKGVWGECDSPCCLWFPQCLLYPWLPPQHQQELCRTELHTQLSGSRSWESLNLSHPTPISWYSSSLVYPDFLSLVLCLPKFSQSFKCQPTGLPPGNLTGCSSTLKVMAGDAQMGTQTCLPAKPMHLPTIHCLVRLSMAITTMEVTMPTVMAREYNDYGFQHGIWKKKILATLSTKPGSLHPPRSQFYCV